MIAWSYDCLQYTSQGRCLKISHSTLTTSDSNKGMVANLEGENSSQSESLCVEAYAGQHSYLSYSKK